MEFTNGLSRDHLNKTTKVIERVNNGVKNKKTLELTIKEFLTKHSLVDNRHTNLLNVIAHLKINPQCPREMLSN